MFLNRKLSGANVWEFLQGVKLPYENQDGAMWYHQVHSQRYAVTLNALDKISLRPEMATLELGAAPYGMSACLASVLGKNLTLATYSDGMESRNLSIGVNGAQFPMTEAGFNVERDVWPFPENAFDLVVACEIVEHLVMDPMALFSGANRVIRPGGYFFVSTPNAASLQNFLKLSKLLPAGLAQHFRRACTIDQIYERHNREYTPFTIGEMFKAAGFEVVIMETDSSYPLESYGFSQDEMDALLRVIGMPEMRRDTVNVIGRKIGPVVERYPSSHELYLAEGA